MTKLIAIVIIVFSAITTYFANYKDRTQAITSIYFNIVSLSAALFWWTL